MLSICIPTYNYGHYLPVAITSCLAGEDDIELVVLDNASTDATSALREKFVHDRRVKWIRNEVLLPQQHNFNKAVSLTTRSFVKVLPADDYFMPGGVARLMDWLQSCPDVKFHGHTAMIVDETGCIIREQRPYRENKSPLSVEGVEALRGKLHQVVRFKEPTCNCFAREIFDAVGGYDDRLRFAFDIEFNIKVMARTNCMLWSEPIIALRRHGQSVGAKLSTSTGLDDLRQVTELVHKLMGNSFTSSDDRAAHAWLQYRLVELAAQRIKRDLKGVCADLWAERALLAAMNAWPQAATMLLRRMRTKDIQKTLRS